MKSFKLIFVLACLTSFSGLSQPLGDDPINNDEVRTPRKTPARTPPRRAREPGDSANRCNAPRKKGRTASPRVFNVRYIRGELMNEQLEEIARLPLLPGEYGTPEFDALHAHDDEDEVRQPRDLTPAFNAPFVELTENEREAEYQLDLQGIQARLFADAMRAMATRNDIGCGWEIGELGFFRF